MTYVHHSNCSSLASLPQNDIYEWSRDHRVHHKYSETDADPHNAKRGFFFAHVGWLFMRKHRDVIEKGKRLDFSDLLADPVVVFQRKWVSHGQQITTNKIHCFKVQILHFINSHSILTKLQFIYIWIDAFAKSWNPCILLMLQHLQSTQSFCFTHSEPIFCLTYREYGLLFHHWINSSIQKVYMVFSKAVTH